MTDQESKALQALWYDSLGTDLRQQALKIARDSTPPSYPYAFGVAQGIIIALIRELDRRPARAE